MGEKESNKLFGVFADREFDCAHRLLVFIGTKDECMNYRASNSSWSIEYYTKELKPGEFKV